MKLFFGLLILISGAVIYSCCTIMHGTTQDIAISSYPSEATVTLDGGMVLGKTPVITELSRKKDHIIKIELEGYMPYEIGLTGEVSGWVWGNIIFGGLIGLAVDAITGGLYVLTPEDVTAELKEIEKTKDTSDSRIEDSQIFITIVLHPDPSWKKIDQLVMQ